MKRNNIARGAIPALASLFLCGMFIGAQPALAQSAVAVVVNGSPMQFQQPPVVRAGRVFVPLRGVFERLGATVVYDNGTINATGSGRNVSLQIGSTQATVDGQSQTLDVAPFIVGASTLVPLRFIAQSLGAQVNWDNNSSTVTISSGGDNGNGYNNDRANRRQPAQAFALLNETPTNWVNTPNPAIRATYSEPVRRGSMRVTIDGRDVTSAVYSNATGFTVTPSFPLRAGSHQVAVTGTTQAGVDFSTAWSFRVGNNAQRPMKNR